MSEVLRIEARAAARIVRRFDPIATVIANVTDELLQALQVQRFKSRRDAVRWLQNEPRYRALQQMAARQGQEWAAYAAEQIAEAQAELVALSQRHTALLIAQQLPPGSQGLGGLLRAVPVDAVNQLVGAFQPSSPLWKLRNLTPEAVRAIGRALIHGATRGESPRRIAQRMKHLGATPARALTISRTEVLRSYREAGREMMMANPQVVEEWTWVSKLGRNTCASCWAMHGRTFPTRQPMGSHPNCACACVPKTKSWERLGITGVPDAQPRIPLGDDLFARQPRDVQLAVLGPEKLAAYERGEIRLADTVQLRQSAEWGDTRSVASLAQARRNAR